MWTLGLQHQGHERVGVGWIGRLILAASKEIILLWLDLVRMQCVSSRGDGTMGESLK